MIKIFLTFRSSVSESLGVSPFDMAFGHHARDPLDVMKEHCRGGKPYTNLVDYIYKFKSKLHETWEFANRNLTLNRRVRLI